MNNIDPIIGAAFNIDCRYVKTIVKEANKRSNIYVMMYEAVKEEVQG